jgi:DNA-binding GntR family transcriptional regulator
VTEHRAILTAIRLRDVEKAAELTAAHIRVPAERLQETVGAGGQPAEELALGTSRETA